MARGHEHISFVFSSTFRYIFFVNDRLFPEKYTVKDYISNTKLEKDDHYIQTRHKDLFSHYNLILRKL